jgi:hypothetical protein
MNLDVINTPDKKIPIVSMTVLNFLNSLKLGFNAAITQRLATMLLTMGLSGFKFKTVQFEKLGDCDRTTYSETLRVLGKLTSYEEWLRATIMNELRKIKKKRGSISSR